MRKGTIKTLVVVGVTSMMLLAQPLMPATVQKMNLFGTTAYAAQIERPVSITLDGVPIVFPDQQPVIVDGRTMLPIKAVFEKLGWTVTWDQTTKASILKKGTNVVFVQMDQQRFMINNALSQPLDVPAQLIGGTSMIPLSAIGEITCTPLSWDSKTQTASIMSASLPSAVKVNGKAVNFNSPPVIVDGEVALSVRDILPALGLVDSGFSYTNGKTSVDLPSGSQKEWDFNGVKVPVMLVDNVWVMPVNRLVAMTGLQAGWDAIPFPNTQKQT